METLENRDIKESEVKLSDIEWKAGGEILEQRRQSSLETRNCGSWAQLAAEMSTIDPEKSGAFGVEVKTDLKSALVEDLANKADKAKQDKNWLPYAALAANVNRIGVGEEIVTADKEINGAILEQLIQLKEEAQKRGDWRTYIELLSKSLIINPEDTPRPYENKDAIVLDVMNRGRATDLKYAAMARVVFPELKAPDFGVNEVEVENQINSYKFYEDNSRLPSLIELEANKTIINAGVVN